MTVMERLHGWGLVVRRHSESQVEVFGLDDLDPDTAKEAVNLVRANKPEILEALKRPWVPMGIASTHPGEFALAPDTVHDLVRHVGSGIYALRRRSDNVLLSVDQAWAVAMVEQKPATIWEQ